MEYERLRGEIQCEWIHSSVVQCPWVLSTGKRTRFDTAIVNQQLSLTYINSHKLTFSLIFLCSLPFSQCYLPICYLVNGLSLHLFISCSFFTINSIWRAQTTGLWIKSRRTGLDWTGLLLFANDWKHLKLWQNVSKTLKLLHFTESPIRVWNLKRVGHCQHFSICTQGGSVSNIIVKARQSQSKGLFCHTSPIYWCCNILLFGSYILYNMTWKY